MKAYLTIGAILVLTGAVAAQTLDWHDWRVAGKVLWSDFDGIFRRTIVPTNSSYIDIFSSFPDRYDIVGGQTIDGRFNARDTLGVQVIDANPARCSAIRIELQTLHTGTTCQWGGQCATSSANTAITSKTWNSCPGELSSSWFGQAGSGANPLFVSHGDLPSAPTPNNYNCFTNTIRIIDDFGSAVSRGCYKTYYWQ